MDWAFCPGLERLPGYFWRQLSPYFHLFWYFVPAMLAVIMMLSITDGISDSDCTLLTIKHPIEKWKCWVINIK